MKIMKISAITLFTRDMKKSNSFYSIIPGFELTYGGPDSDFTTYRVAKDPEMYLNLEKSEINTCDFGRIIFLTDDVDKLYHHLKNKDIIANLGIFETEPADAVWGERFFHMRDPDGYQISFAAKLNM